MVQVRYTENGLLCAPFTLTIVVRRRGALISRKVSYKSYSQIAMLCTILGEISEQF